MNDTYQILQKAIAQYESGEFEHAIKTTGEAAGDKEYAFTYNELTAHCYYELGQYSNAIWFYEKAIKLEPAKSGLQSRLAAAYDLSGQPKKAALLHRKHVKAHPDDPHFVY